MVAPLAAWLAKKDGTPPRQSNNRRNALLWVTIGLDADVGHLHLALSLFARLEAFNRRIPTPPQCQIDPLQHDVVDFETLLEGDLA